MFTNRKAMFRCKRRVIVQRWKSWRIRFILELQFYVQTCAHNTETFAHPIRIHGCIYQRIIAHYCRATQNSWKEWEVHRVWAVGIHWNRSRYNVYARALSWVDSHKRRKEDAMNVNFVVLEIKRFSIIFWLCYKLCLNSWKLF